MGGGGMRDAGDGGGFWVVLVAESSSHELKRKGREWLVLGWIAD